jgi:hypothetical protein
MFFLNKEIVYSLLNIEKSRVLKKLIYVLDENNIHDDSEYFYLTKLAAKCTAKRMVPDYISAKIMKELKKGNVYTCMGLETSSCKIF